MYVHQSNYMFTFNYWGMSGCVKIQIGDADGKVIYLRIIPIKVGQMNEETTFRNIADV